MVVGMTVIQIVFSGICEGTPEGRLSLPPRQEPQGQPIPREDPLSDNLTLCAVLIPFD